MITEPWEDPKFCIRQFVYLASETAPTLRGKIREFRWAGKPFGWVYCVRLDGGQEVWAADSVQRLRQLAR